MKTKKLTNVKNKEKLIIGIAHDYVQFDRNDSKIQVPIIYIYEMVEQLRKSGFISWSNFKLHGYQSKYSKFLDVEMWCQDSETDKGGIWKLKPKTSKETVIHKIERTEIKR